MPRSADQSVATMGIDIGRNSFHVVGLDQRGAIVVREPVGEHATLFDRHGGMRRGWAMGVQPPPEVSLARLRFFRSICSRLRRPLPRRVARRQ
jgi:hypothetical protein